MRLDDLADLVAWLPPGCALWRATGGELAWPLEMHGLASVDLNVRGLIWQNAGDKNAPKPEPWEPPPLAADERAEQKVVDRRAERYLKRQQKR